MTVHENLEQGTYEWLMARIGKVSGSKVKNIMGARGLGKSAETYALELIGEELTGEPTQVPTNFAMEWGTEHEPEAREIYETAKGVEVLEVGGIESGRVWFSPDGLVSDDGIIEIKCPQPKQYLKILMSDQVLPDYVDQLDFGMMVTGCKYCDFIAYQPQFPDDKSFKVIRYLRDEKRIEHMKERILEFYELVDNIKNKL